MKIGEAHHDFRPAAHEPLRGACASEQVEPLGLELLVEGLLQVNPHSECMLLVLESTFDGLRDVGDLILSRSILPESCLLWGDVLLVFQTPHQSCVDAVRRFISFPTQLVKLMGR